MDNTLFQGHLAEYSVNYDSNVLHYVMSCFKQSLQEAMKRFVQCV